LKNARKTTRKLLHSVDPQQSRDDANAQAKATLKELQEARRKHCIEHVQRDFASSFKQ
jgi:hypothetical protein